MATIYQATDGEIITEGLQGSNFCDEAIIAARQIAKERDERVILEDDDGSWIVDPAGNAAWLGG